MCERWPTIGLLFPSPAPQRWNTLDAHAPRGRMDAGGKYQRGSGACLEPDGRKRKERGGGERPDPPIGGSLRSSIGSGLHPAAHCSTVGYSHAGQSVKVQTVSLRSCWGINHPQKERNGRVGGRTEDLEMSAYASLFSGVTSHALIHSKEHVCTRSERSKWPNTRNIFVCLLLRFPDSKK